MARYVRGGPIKNGRLLAFDGESVTFRKSRRGEPIENVRLGIDEFIRRILSHVPPIGFRTVRTYGLYAPGKNKQRERCREMLGGGAVPEGDESLLEEIPGAKERGAPEERIEDLYCTVCGLELEKRQIPRRSLFEAAKIAHPRRAGAPPRAPPSAPGASP